MMDRKCFKCGNPNHLIGDCPKPSRNKDQKAFIGGSWSDSENDAEDKTNDETCLMAQSSNERDRYRGRGNELVVVVVLKSGYWNLGMDEKFGWWFEQDICGESEDDREKKLVMVSEEEWMS
ncbi:zf-CCHC domain-containing protein [Tanacetum coccineum]